MNNWRSSVYHPKEVEYSESWWKEISTAVKRRDHYKCFRCESKYKRELSVHHVIPRSEGGEDNPENLITLCAKCHDIVEIAGCKTKADIQATIDENDTEKAKQEETDREETDREETFIRPEWHKWVYGGVRRPTDGVLA